MPTLNSMEDTMRRPKKPPRPKINGILPEGVLRTSVAVILFDEIIEVIDQRAMQPNGRSFSRSTQIRLDLMKMYGISMPEGKPILKLTPGN